MGNCRKGSKFLAVIILLLLLIHTNNSFALGKKRPKDEGPVCPSEPSTKTIKMLTFNVQALPKPLLRGPLKRFRETVRYIEDYGYDIVLIQEAFAKSAIEIFRESNFQYKHMGIYGDMFPIIINKIGDGLITLSKFPIVKKMVVTYSPFKCLFFDCFAHKGGIISRIELDEGVQIDVVNTHTQSIGGFIAKAIRKSQIKHLAKFQKKHDIGNSVFIGGDFNSPPNKSVYPKILKRFKARDAWTDYIEQNPELPEEVKKGYTSSNENYFHRNKPDSRNKRIDFFFYRPGANSNIHVDYSEVVFKRETYDGKRHLSDHFGVETVFTIETNPCN